MWAVWQNGLQVFVCVLALRKLCVLIGIDPHLTPTQFNGTLMIFINCDSYMKYHPIFSVFRSMHCVACSLKGWGGGPYV